MLQIEELIKDTTFFNIKIISNYEETDLIMSLFPVHLSV